MYKEINRIENVNGNILRHSDIESVMRYKFRNETGELVKILKSEIKHIRLNDYTRQNYIEVLDYSVVQDDIEFRIPLNVLPGTYFLEIMLKDGRYFPANDDERIILRNSSLNAEAKKIEVHGFDSVVNEVVRKIDISGVVVDENRIESNVIERLNYVPLDQENFKNEILNSITFPEPPPRQVLPKVDVTSIGVKNNGEDTTNELQNALDSYTQLYFPEGVYRFNKVTITQSDTNIEAHPRAIFEATADINNVSTGGIEVIGNGRTSLVTDLSENTKPNVDSIKLISVEGFSVGDFIEISQNSPKEHEKVLDVNVHGQRWVDSIYSIKSIDIVNNEIKLNESLLHEYQVINTAKVYKVELIKNVNIDLQGGKVDKMGTTSLINNIFVEYAYNVKLNNVYATRGGGKGISFSKTHTYYVGNLVHDKPTKLTSGAGYGLQAEKGSTNGLIENLKSFGGRHAVDFAKGAGNAIVRNSYAYGGGFNGHGMNVKNILFENCVAYNSGFNVGNDTFLSDENVTFYKCKVYNHTVGFSVSNTSKNIEIIDCEVYNVSTGIIILQDSENVNIKNFKANDVNMVVDFRPSQNVKIDGLIANNIQTFGFLIRSGAKLPDIKNVEFNSNNAQLIGISATDTKGLKLENIKMRGTYKKAIQTVGDVEGIELIAPDLLIDAEIVCDFGTNRTNINLNIMNALNVKSTRSGESHGVFVQKSNVNIVSSKIDKLLCLNVPEGVALKNSEINGYCNIRCNKDVFINGNTGKGTKQFPEENISNNVVVGFNNIV